MAEEQPLRGSTIGHLDPVQIGDYTVSTGNMRRPIGRGRFGAVHMATNNEGHDVAAKRLEKNITDVHDKEYLKDLMALYQLPRNHLNITKIYDKKWDSYEDLWILMEYCRHGNLNKYFTDFKNSLTNFDTKLDIMCQIANGLDYLHANKTIHRNMKPSNILVTSTLDQPECHVIKIADFTATKYLDPGLSSTMSTDVSPEEYYRAPEFYLIQGPQGKIKYKKSIDVYATGLMFLAMLLPMENDGLVPRVECQQLDDTEIHMPIGQIMYNRHLQGKSPIQVAEEGQQYSHDENMVRRVVKWATCPEPTFRISANELQIYLNQIKMYPGAELQRP